MVALETVIKYQADVAVRLDYPGSAPHCGVFTARDKDAAQSAVKSRVADITTCCKNLRLLQV